MEVNYKTIVDISWKDGSMSYLMSTKERSVIQGELQRCFHLHMDVELDDIFIRTENIKMMTISDFFEDNPSVRHLYPKSFWKRLLGL